MDYKFTFQDGSECLMHKGVKGMRWGVRKAKVTQDAGFQTSMSSEARKQDIANRANKILSKSSGSKLKAKYKANTSLTDALASGPRKKKKLKALKKPKWKAAKNGPSKLGKAEEKAYASYNRKYASIAESQQHARNKAS